MKTRRSEREAPNWAEEKPWSADAESFVRRSTARRNEQTSRRTLLCVLRFIFFFLRNGVIDAALYVLFTAWCFCGGFVVNFGVRAAVG